MKKIETLIIGAGAAGLACASRLTKAGRESAIVEARSRIGGRVLTHRSVGHDKGFALELGAEFIHGTPNITLERLARLQLPFYDAADHQLFRQGARLTPHPNFFEEMGALMKKLRAPNQKDRSVRDFLESHHVPSDRKTLFTGFVEGFLSADIEKMGEHALKDTEETDEADFNGVESFRIPAGYDTFLAAVANESTAPVHLGLEVTAIRWKKNDVTVELLNHKTGRSETWRAKKLVITVPLGVLKANKIEWDPMPRGLPEALERLHMGHVTRLVFTFRTRFWESLSKDPVSFLHAKADRFFPTWWTFAPARTPHLVGWQGGPKAKEMSSWSDAQKRDVALETLAEISARNVSELKKELVDLHHHDWTVDPNSLGAYSYIGVDGIRSWRRLLRPFDETLFFAGEATAEGSERGTVHGALNSGERAARHLIKFS